MSRLEHPAGSGYAPGHDIGSAWAVGAQGELSALAILEASLEVKSDQRSQDRIFIEYACLWSDGTWHDSGIRTTEADAWVFVLPGCYLIVETARLRMLTERMVVSTHRARRDPPDDWGLVDKPKGPKDEFATRGVVVPYRSLNWLGRL